MSDHETFRCIEQTAALVSQLAGARPGTLDWTQFGELEAVVREFEIPSTTITPHMSALLWAIARTNTPNVVVGVGAYVGVGLAWLAGLASVPRSPRSVVGIDIDMDACAIGRRNLALLGFGDQASISRADGLRYAWSGAPVDLLFIDVDDRERRKADYALVLRAWVHHLAAGALVLAHDACVPGFERDINRWRREVRRLGLRGPVDLPIDRCGLAVAVK